MRIIVAGDLLPWTNNAHLFKSGDARTLFGDKVCQLFETADYSIVNLEGPLTDASVGQCKIGPVIKAEKETVRGLQALKVKAVALANNHITDYLQQGIEDTISVLKESGIEYVGVIHDPDKSREDSYLSVTDGQHKVCIYNVSETFYNRPDKDHLGANIYDEWVVLNDIKELKQRHDYLIVIYHGGSEYFPYPTPQTRKRFYRMADCGADFITAQHTHCIGCEEWYNGSYLLYGQGNFLFSKHMVKPMKKEGLIMEIQLNDKGVTINRHRVQLNPQACLVYSEDQSLSAFYERSKNVNNKELIFEAYKYTKSDEYLENYLLAYKGRRYIWNKLKRLLPKRVWLKLIASFSDHQMMRNLYVMISDRTFEDIYFLWQRVIDINKKK